MRAYLDKNRTQPSFWWSSVSSVKAWVQSEQWDQCRGHEDWYPDILFASTALLLRCFSHSLTLYFRLRCSLCLARKTGRRQSIMSFHHQNNTCLFKKKKFVKLCFTFFETATKGLHFPYLHHYWGGEDHRVCEYTQWCCDCRWWTCQHISHQVNNTMPLRVWLYLN